MAHEHLVLHNILSALRGPDHCGETKAEADILYQAKLCLTAPIRTAFYNLTLDELGGPLRSTIPWEELEFPPLVACIYDGDIWSHKTAGMCAKPGTKIEYRAIQCWQTIFVKMGWGQHFIYHVFMAAGELDIIVRSYSCGYYDRE